MNVLLADPPWEYRAWSKKESRAAVCKDVTESQLIIAPRREHSRKPDEQYGKIERLYPDADRKIELFARQQRPGWESFGNETEKFT